MVQVTGTLPLVRYELDLRDTCRDAIRRRLQGRVGGHGGRGGGRGAFLPMAGLRCWLHDHPMFLFLGKTFFEGLVGLQMGVCKYYPINTLAFECTSPLLQGVFWSCRGVFGVGLFKRLSKSFGMVVVFC